MKQTKIIFRKFKDEILALFPELPGTYNPNTCCCYAHVGQHSSVNYDMIIANSKPATPDEYNDLLYELKHYVGYENIRVMKKASYKSYLIRRESIK